jgi:hypothetical protein
MAKLSDLIAALSQLLPMPEQTVAVYARLLRQERLLSTGGRGPGAANMSPDDCARLLLAIMAADQVKDAVEAVERFWSLPVEFLQTRETQPKAERKNWLPLPESLSALKEEQSLGSALVGLIAAARDDQLASSLEEVALPFMKIEVERRFRTAAVSLMASSDGLVPDKPMLMASYAPAKSTLRKLEEMSGFSEGGDAIVTFAVSQRTILALGELIRN